MTALPADGPLLAFYGDDFTGSTAVLEALAFAGLPTILFFEEPTASMIEKAGPHRAIGLAGLSRSKSPVWMDANLPRAFKALAAIGAPLVHYKICSTFDSSPHTGSIGKAIEVALEAFDCEWVPVVTAAPSIRRWQAFGNLFAGSGDSVYRIDRHPVMSRHPVTPSHEADLRRHLGLQTGLEVGLVDLVDLKNGAAEGRIASETASGARIMLLDVVDDDTLRAVGDLVWKGRSRHPFVVGSQGLEYALLAHWRAKGLLPARFDPPPLARRERIAVVSGSCSPTTAAQISHAEGHGFHAIRADATLALDARAWEGEILRCAEDALTALGNGRDPLVYTARGPDDVSIARLEGATKASDCDRQALSHRIGSGLGQILNQIVEKAKIRRVVVSGGDSSGQACHALGLSAVTALAPIEPSAPLCRAISATEHLDGLEVALKGGQMGSADYFSRARG